MYIAIDSTESGHAKGGSHSVLLALVEYREPSTYGLPIAATQHAAASSEETITVTVHE